MIYKIFITLFATLLFNQAYALSNFELERLSDIDYRDNTNTKINDINLKNISIKFNKKNKVKSYTDEEGHYIPAHNSIEGYVLKGNVKKKFLSEKYVYGSGENVFDISCSKNGSNYLILMIQSYNSGIRFGSLEFITHIYQINENGLSEIKEKNISILGSGGEIVFDPSWTPHYKYYNKKLLLKRLYETKLCAEPALTIKQLGNNKGDIKEITKNYLKNYLIIDSISGKTLTSYNNIAYYLEKAKAYPEAIYLLEKIIDKYPNRTVAYINLGDAYWGLKNKEKAKQAYSTYIKQMKEKGKERKIPKVVLERIK
ncbi:tetratricopeptide repeat protein [Sulfurimonas sp.]|uniref:tetratricopeptide repeat protein n=1 Tax=Sulfurimonas sp. TaxID=2022749 RepID=UPI002B4724FA|nr:tetratricopeptide repeat protein [Sulfurimonas sp.]